MEQYPFLPIGLCFVKRIKVPGFGGRWPIRVEIFKLGKGGRSRFRARYLAKMECHPAGWGRIDMILK
jgi:hypothetical protein